MSRFSMISSVVMVRNDKRNKEYDFMVPHVGKHRIVKDIYECFHKQNYAIGRDGERMAAFRKLYENIYDWYSVYSLEALSINYPFFGIRINDDNINFSHCSEIIDGGFCLGYFTAVHVGVRNRDFSIHSQTPYTRWRLEEGMYFNVTKTSSCVTLDMLDYLLGEEENKKKCEFEMNLCTNWFCKLFRKNNCNMYEYDNSFRTSGLDLESFKYLKGEVLDSLDSTEEVPEGVYRIIFHPVFIRELNIVNKPSTTYDENNSSTTYDE